jgi:peptidoglycan-N-acetylglucosamine deacetylase
VDTFDWRSRNVGQILAGLKKQTRPGALILLHDGDRTRAVSVKALPKDIDELLQKGYSLTTVEKLLGS